MKKNIVKTSGKLILIVITALVFNVVQATDGTTAKFNLSQESDIVVTGTSSLHDWEMDVTKISGHADMIIEGNTLKSIDNVSVSIPVKSLKSGKGAMDNNAYEALKESKHPTITYKLNRIEDKGSGKFTAVGNLTIAGETKSMEIPVEYEVLSASKIKIKGSITFNMSEFNIEPPTAMWGTIKTGDEVKLHFNTSFTK